jgi:uncharacterized protein DUF268
MNGLRKYIQFVGYKLVELANWSVDKGALNLIGDRDIEWAWVAAALPETPGRVLDLGPATSSTPMMAALRGGTVEALDLDPPAVSFSHANLRYIKGDILHNGLPPGNFDTIINCSTTEHIGLSGRYGSTEEQDGDLRAMQLLRDRMAPAARMIFTIPVGRDKVAAPYHRIYGPERLPRVLSGFRVERREYFAKIGQMNTWQAVSPEVALDVEGSARFYALGLFVLAAA